MEMENHHEARLEIKDWSSLPTELLEQFCKWLRITDQAHFGIVCKAWLASTADKSQIWVPEAPWLITNDDRSSQFQILRNYSDKKVLKIYKPFKPLCDAFIVGSFKGWLIIRSEAKLFILNLLCKLRINLPPPNTVPDFISSSKFIYMDTPLAFAIATCAKLNPILVAMVTYGGDLCWCKIGDTAWKGYRGDDESTYGNVAFHNEKLYAVERDGDQVDIFRVDELVQVLIPVATILSAEPDIQIQPQSDPIDVYLVECGGRLLVVKRYYDNSQILRSTLRFVILRVEEDCGELVRVDSLEDHVLFVAVNLFMLNTVRDFNAAVSTPLATPQTPSLLNWGSFVLQMGLCAGGFSVIPTCTLLFGSCLGLLLNVTANHVTLLLGLGLQNSREKYLLPKTSVT